MAAPLEPLNDYDDLPPSRPLLIQQPLRSYFQRIYASSTAKIYLTLTLT